MNGSQKKSKKMQRKNRAHTNSGYLLNTSGCQKHGQTMRRLFTNDAHAATNWQMLQLQAYF